MEDFLEFFFLIDRLNLGGSFASNAGPQSSTFAGVAWHSKSNHRWFGHF